MFQCPGWMRKNFISRNFSWRVATETWDASCFKKGLLEKQQSVSNTCAILPLKKIFYQNLIEAFFKYLWRISSQLFQIYSLYRYYAVLIFTSKLHDPLPNKITHPHQNKNYWPPHPAKSFLKFLPPAPPPSPNLGTCPEKWRKQKQKQQQQKRMKISSF